MATDTDRVTFGVGWGLRLSASRDVELSVLAEELGLDGVWPGEHPTARFAGYEPHIVLTYIAAKTERIKLGTAAYLLPLSHPVRLAKQLTTLDHLSNGRVILGAGSGGEMPKQYADFGIDVEERGPRTNEYIQLLRALWGESPSDFHGRFFDLEQVTMEPKPVQGSIPIWICGRPGGMEMGPDGQPRRKSRTASIRRAGKYGDGWMPYYMSPESYRASVEQVRAVATEEGRDPSKLAMGLNCFMFIDDSYGAALERAYGPRSAPPIGRERVEQYDFLGTAKELVPRIEQYIDAGCRHFVCKLETTPEQVATHMEYLAKEVVPHFR